MAVAFDTARELVATAYAAIVANRDASEMADARLLRNDKFGLPFQLPEHRRPELLKASLPDSLCLFVKVYVVFPSLASAEEQRELVESWRFRCGPHDGGAKTLLADECAAFLRAVYAVLHALPAHRRALRQRLRCELDLFQGERDRLWNLVDGGAVVARNVARLGAIISRWSPQPLRLDLAVAYRTAIPDRPAALLQQVPPPRSFSPTAGRHSPLSQAMHTPFGSPPPVGGLLAQAMHTPMTTPGSPPARPVLAASPPPLPPEVRPPNSLPLLAQQQQSAADAQLRAVCTSLFRPRPAPAARPPARPFDLFAQPPAPASAAPSASLCLFDVGMAPFFQPPPEPVDFAAYLDTCRFDFAPETHSPATLHHLLMQFKT